MSTASSRHCHACGSAWVTLFPRGYTGGIDTPDQYFRCEDCGQVTYEIIAVSQREIRLNRYEVNGIFDRDGVPYRIRRILKVGFNEFLLYVRPEVDRLALNDQPEHGLTRPDQQ